MKVLYAIYTPQKKICLGQLCIGADNQFYIRIKKPQKNDFEYLPVAQLLEVVMHTLPEEKGAAHSM